MNWKLAYIDNRDKFEAGAYKNINSNNYSITEFAAIELKKYLEIIDTELEVAILSYRSYHKELEDVLWIGVSNELPIECPQVDSSEFDDSISIDVTDGRGMIAGSNERAVLIAAYRFLRELGCYWIRPGKGGEIICKKTLENTVRINIKEKASFRHRGITIEGAVSYDHVVDMIEWMPKVGMTAYFSQFMIPFTFYDRWYAHKSNPAIAPEKISMEEVKGIHRQTINEIKKRGLLYHAVGHGWTCEPFGIPGDEWEAREYNIPEETRKYIALVDGKRELFRGIPLLTNMCYSDKEVQRIMVEAITEYCKSNKQVDYLHVWLGDSVNSQCECGQCGDTRPSDLYIDLLNAIDRSLTENNLHAKIVFLLYLDLLWEPLNGALENQDRFVLMFAPITRTYTDSLSDTVEFDESKLPPYQKNKIVLPKSVDENLAWMKKWQKKFKGDSFIFDYHYMWDHFKDPGYYSMAKVLLNDIKSYQRLGLNGLVSCQNQRVFFPSALGMIIMAEALWNVNVDFEVIASEYFLKAFGEDGDKVKLYLASISELFDPEYLRNEKPKINYISAEKFASIPEKVNDFKAVIDRNLAVCHPEPVYLSWKYLSIHGELCVLLSKALFLRATGDADAAKAALDEAISFVGENEKIIADVFDFYEFENTMKKSVFID